MDNLVREMRFDTGISIGMPFILLVLRLRYSSEFGKGKQVEKDVDEYEERSLGQPNRDNLRRDLRPWSPPPPSFPPSSGVVTMLSSRQRLISSLCSWGGKSNNPSAANAAVSSFASWCCSLFAPIHFVT
jgi:hypothetical protein